MKFIDEAALGRRSSDTDGIQPESRIRGNLVSGACSERSGRSLLASNLTANPFTVRPNHIGVSKGMHDSVRLDSGFIRVRLVEMFVNQEEEIH
jgi:hypothetical protein